MTNLCFMSNLTSSEMAAWVQAWGTIAAVLASAFVVWFQHRLQDRREQNAASRRARELISNRRLSIGYLAGDLFDLIDGFATRERVAGFLEFPDRGVEDLFARLARMEADMSDGFTSEHAMLIRKELIAVDTRFRARLSRHQQSFEHGDKEFLLLKRDRARKLLDVAIEAHKSTAEYRWQDPG